MTTEIILAGFGGQGILFAGKILAYCGLIAGKELSWLPSYGPEMRGGTANCSVCISDEPIGSPLVTTPDYLIAMNGPSYKKFIDAVKPGGLVLFDNSIVEETCERTDITAISLPATDLATDAGLNGAAILLKTQPGLSESENPGCVLRVVWHSKSVLYGTDFEKRAIGGYPSWHFRRQRERSSILKCQRHPEW